MGARIEFTTNAREIRTQIRGLRGELRRIESSSRGSRRGVDNFARSTSSLNFTLGRTIGLTDRTTRSLTGLTAVFSRIAGVGIVAPLLAATAALTGLAAASDRYIQTTNRIIASGVGFENLADSLIQLERVSERTFTNLADVIPLFQRINIAGVEFGRSTEDAVRNTETLVQTFRIAGATVQESAAFSTQIAQAIGSGVLQGDELRTVLESNVVFAQAIAEEMGTTVGHLRDLGSEGRITTDVVFRALDNQAEQIAERFGQLNRTFPELFQQTGAIISSISNQAALASNNVRPIREAVMDFNRGLMELRDSGVVLDLFDSLSQAFTRLSVNFEIFSVRIRSFFEDLGEAIMEAFQPEFDDVNLQAEERVRAIAQAQGGPLRNPLLGTQHKPLKKAADLSKWSHSAHRCKALTSSPLERWSQRMKTRLALLNSYQT